MSEKVIRVNLSELKTVRVVCPKFDCKAVIEIQLESLAKQPIRAACDRCTTAFFKAGLPDDPLQEFAKAIARVKAVTDVDLEFVLPDMD